MGKECRDWADGKTDRAVKAIITEPSSDEDAVVFTDGMLIEVKAITESLRYLQLHQCKKRPHGMDSMSTLQKVCKE